MFVTGIAVIVYAVYAVLLLVGGICIVFGVRALRRGLGGLGLVIVGAIIVLLPVGVAASSYLPGQH